MFRVQGFRVLGLWGSEFQASGFYHFRRGGRGARVFGIKACGLEMNARGLKCYRTKA